MAQPPGPPPTPPWHRALAAAERDAPALCRRLGLDPAHYPGLDAKPGDFGLLVPPTYLSRIRCADPNDPLLRQVLPTLAERARIPGYVADPLDEADARGPGGLLRKYHGRALLALTGACAIHCRFCFRRHTRSVAVAETGRDAAALAAIAIDTSIRELILSGGDPLLASDRRLASLFTQLANIAHLRRLRIHSRAPVVLPERIDAGLCRILTELPLIKVLVVHVNHARELGPEAGRALADLHHCGVQLLNQSTLLAGVNDNAGALCELSETLAEHRVLPYYLHQLDPVAGAAHFQVSDAQALNLLETLRERLPGYLVPRLVRELPGETAKRPLQAARDGRNQHSIHGKPCQGTLDLPVCPHTTGSDGTVTTPAPNPGHKG